MAIDPFAKISHLLALLDSEVFGKKPNNPNKPLYRSSHPDFIQIVTDRFKPRMVTAAGLTFKWGMSGKSDETTDRAVSARWGFTGRWL